MGTYDKEIINLTVPQCDSSKTQTDRRQKIYWIKNEQNSKKINITMKETYKERPLIEIR